MNHKYPIETGRWQNIAREDRKCLLCNSQDIGDEYHYIFSCRAFDIDRSRLLRVKFRHRPNILNIHELI